MTSPPSSRARARPCSAAPRSTRGARPTRWAAWTALTGADLEGELAALEPGRIGPALAWSETLDQQAQLGPGFSPCWPFTRLGLLDLPQASLDALWPSLENKIGAWVRSASGIHDHGRGVEEGAELVPLVWNGSLRVVPVKVAAGSLAGGNARLLGPTAAGWEEFLRRLPAAREAEGERRVAHLEALRAARYWWDRALPAKKGE